MHREIVRWETTPDASEPQVSSIVEDMAARYGKTGADFLRAVEDELAAGTADGILLRLGTVPRLPIDHPAFFGGDPAVDDTVRTLLRTIRQRLPNVSRAVWMRLSEALEAVISFVAGVRDVVPGYCRCAHDGGEGRKASENSLRDDLFRNIRQHLGRRGLLEAGPLAGGRTDTGIAFPECMFPVECKAEHRTIDRSHIHSHYVAQPDDYAAARDGVAFILILDLREENAAGHQKARRKGQGSPASSAPSPVSLYALPESFWIDGLAPDPQVVGAQQKAVVVGLVPGNRSLPSSKTTYSRAPKTP
jgi:hypothetical protein